MSMSKPKNIKEKITTYILNIVRDVNISFCSINFITRENIYFTEANMKLL